MPTITWRDGTSGDWSNAANWAGDEVPGGSDTASVTGTGEEIITIDQAATIAALTLQDASATLIIAGSLLLTGDGDTAASSGSALNGGTVILRGTLDLGGGTLTVGAGSAGVVELANGGTIINGTIIDQGGGLVGSSGTVAIRDTLDLGGGTLTVGPGSALGTLPLDGGTIANGTIIDQGNGLLGSGGTLSAVTYQGALDLGPDGSTSLALTGGTTFIGADGVSPGTVNVEGPGDTLYLAGADTLDNATLNLGSSTYWYYGSNRLVGTDPAGQGAVQTLGPNLIIQQTGLAEINSDPSSGGVVNEGIILATAGQEFDIDGTAFTNTGFIDAENGTYLRIDPTSASNTGVITATGGYLILDNVDNSGMVSATGGSLTLDNVDNSGMVSVIDGSLTLDNVTNTGVISETNSTVNLMGSISLASLESLQLNGGWVTVTGTLDLGGGTLTVGAGSALSTLQLDWGTITNGTIIDQGGGLTGYYGTLSAVAYQGTLDLGESWGTVLTLANGTTVNGADGISPGTLNVEGPNVTLYLSGADTLDNSTLNLGYSNYYLYYGTSRLVGTDPTGQGAVQTLGPNLVIQQTASAEINSDSSSGGIVNEGTILATAGAEFVIDGTAFTNTGSIDAENGTYLCIDPTSASNTGVITANGATVELDNLSNGGMVSVTNGTLTLNNVSNTGLISETDSTVNLMGSISLATLESLQLNGGSLVISGTLDLGGGTLTLGQDIPLTNLQVANGGAIINGTVAEQSGPGIEPPPLPGDFIISDATTGQTTIAGATPYTGPVAELTDEFILATTDQVTVTAQIPNVFIQIGGPAQANPVVAGIDVSQASGINVLDSYANSSFLTNGSGIDQDYLNIRNLTQNGWSTVANFGAGDNVTVWGVTPDDFALQWIGDTQGAPGATGLTGMFVPTADGQPELGITLAGFTMADLSNGRLSVGYNSIDGTPYASIHAN